MMGQANVAAVGLQDRAGRKKTITLSFDLEDPGDKTLYMAIKSHAEKGHRPSLPQHMKFVFEVLLGLSKWSGGWPSLHGYFGDGTQNPARLADDLLKKAVMEEIAKKILPFPVQRSNGSAR